MASKDLKSAYKTIVEEHFPPRMEIRFENDDGLQTLSYEKAAWNVAGESKGLRYGENPGQEAALYRLVNGNLRLGDVECVQPGKYLASDVELLQSGKHPGKINITDVDSALNILRYLSGTPCTVIMKHNNPCGAARGSTLAESYDRANMADRLAAFGGAIAFNREVDLDTAKMVVANYAEVVAAPAFADGVLDLFAGKKNLRVMRVQNMARLEEFETQRFVDFKSLLDGGVIAQWSYLPQVRRKEDFLPAQTTYKDTEYRVARPPTDRELDDLLFGWLVEAGVTSNSVLYVKDGATVGIGTGEQDRVGVAEIARDKAYRKLEDRFAWERHQTPFHQLKDEKAQSAIRDEVREKKGGLVGSCMISDGFFPFRDGVDVGIREGVTAIAQPGGSLRDFESIEACNEAGATMVFTGERSFRHWACRPRATERV